jgi:3-hydroxyacyl-CoA dehydrogenase
MNEFITSKKARTEIIEKTLRKRLKHRDINEKDHAYLKQVLSNHRLIDATEVDTALESVLKQPQVRMQIRTAREVYRDADEILNSLTLDKGIGFGATVGRKGGLWDNS